MTSTHPNLPTPRWPYLFILLAPMFLFAPFLLGQQVLYWGTPLLQFYPWRQFALDALRAGHLPLWNPLVGHGAPLIANYQSAVFYPPNWLALIMPLDYSMGWLVTLHLMWAGVGMALLARTLGLKPLGQVVAGLAFGLSQYLVARAGFLSINAAAAWVPWVIWAAEAAIHRRSPASQRKTLLRGFLFFSLFLAFQLLAGHAQTTWYTLLLLGAWTLWRTLTPIPPYSHTRLLSLAFILLPILLAFGLAALQLLPTAELLRESPRATAAEYEFVMTYSLSPWRLLTLLAPDLLGHPARGLFFGYGNYWEDAIYIGLLPLLLAIGALLSALRQPPAVQRLVVFLSLLCVVVTLIALGRNTPIFPFLYQHVPTFNLFQAPTRWMILFTFAAALLAGLGADGWQAPQGRALYWTRLSAAGAAAITFIGVAALVTLPAATKLDQQFRTVALALAMFGFTLLVAILLALLKPNSPTPTQRARRWEYAVAVFISIDLLVAGYGLNPGAPPDLYRAPAQTSAALATALDGHRLYQFGDDESVAKFSLLSFLSFGPPEWAYATRAAQIPAAGMLDGLATASNFDPLLPARYANFIAAVDKTQSLTLLRLMDVAVLASERPLDWEVITHTTVATRTVTFYQVPVKPHRVWIVYSARTVTDGDAALAALTAPAFDPATEVILEANDASPTPLEDPRSEADGANPRTSLTPSPNVITIPVSLSKPGWVVLSDTHYPGWVAYVDEQPTPLLHANYAFRAVAVGAGQHTVTFLYQPRSFAVGLWVSGVSGLVWLMLLGAYWWPAFRRLQT